MRGKRDQEAELLERVFRGARMVAGPATMTEHRPLPPPPPDPQAELRRLAASEQPAMWASPCRSELRAAGLIELCYDERDMWVGDQLTAKGWSAHTGAS
jgi:hypothetical protein